MPPRDGLGWDRRPPSAVNAAAEGSRLPRITTPALQLHLQSNDVALRAAARLHAAGDRERLEVVAQLDEETDTEESELRVLVAAREHLATRAGSRSPATPITR